MNASIPSSNRSKPKAKLSSGYFDRLLMSGFWGLAFTGFPYAIALKTASAGAVGASFILFFPFAFLTTSALPLQALTGWMAAVARFNPMTYLLAGLRSLLYADCMDMQRLTMDLCEAFPSATIAAPLTILGEGFGSVAIATANGLVFRIAKHREAQRGHQRERDVLPVIQRSGVGLRIPEVAYFLEASTSFPFGGIGYAKIPSHPLAPADLTRDNHAQIAGQVAAFLRALHGIDVDHLRDADLPRFPPSPTRLRELWQNVLAYLEKHLSRVEYGQLQQRQEDLLAYGQRYPYTPTLVHGDCWYENLLFDAEQQRLVGIIDFENVSIGDAALDLATQRYLGDRFAQKVIAAYYPDHAPAGLSARMRDILAVRELLGLEQGILLGNVDADALEKVKTTIFSPPQ